VLRSCHAGKVLAAACRAAHHALDVLWLLFADIVEIKHIMLPPSPREFKDIYVVFELMETDLHQVGVGKANDRVRWWRCTGTATPKPAAAPMMQWRRLHQLAPSFISHQSLQASHQVLDACCCGSSMVLRMHRQMCRSWPTAGI